MRGVSKSRLSMSAFPDSHFLAGCLGSRCRHSERFSAPTDHLQPRSTWSKFWCWSRKKIGLNKKKMRLNDFFQGISRPKSGLLIGPFEIIQSDSWIFLKLTNQHRPAPLISEIMLSVFQRPHKASFRVRRSIFFQRFCWSAGKISPNFLIWT